MYFKNVRAFLRIFCSELTKIRKMSRYDRQWPAVRALKPRVWILGHVSHTKWDLHIRIEWYCGRYSVSSYCNWFTAWSYLSNYPVIIHLRRKCLIFDRLKFLIGISIPANDCFSTTRLFFRTVNIGWLMLDTLNCNKNVLLSQKR